MCNSPRGTREVVPSLAGLLLVAAGGAALADDLPAPASVHHMQQQLDAQTQQIEMLQLELARQKAALAELRRSLDLGARGRGDATAAANPAPAPASPAPALAQAETTEPARPVGQAPAAPERPPEVAPLGEAPGVLTPKDVWVIEPSLQYAYASSDRIALVGYTVIPAILIGLIDVRTVRSNTFVGTMTFRRGITNRFELEARVPYVYRFDNTQGREVFTGASTDNFFIDQNGSGIGDVELIGRYQINDGDGTSPYYIASLRYKTHTGKDPFEVRTAFTVDGARTSGVQEELPTGSGFYSITPGLTVLIPSDPAVFFAGISYQYSFSRSNVSVNAVDVPPGFADYKEIQPGGIWGFNFGMGLALNERSSFSLGYEQLSVGKTDATFANGTRAQGTIVQLGTLSLGYSYKVDAKRTLNLSVGVGVTDDSPDIQLTLRMPYSL
jgi:hypothetical protein